MIRPPSRSARARARADLPLAVGPAIRTGRCLGAPAPSPIPAMDCVATLISNPAHPALDGSALQAARDALASPGTPVWLAEGIAADIPFEPGDGLDARAVEARIREALG